MGRLMKILLPLLLLFSIVEAGTPIGLQKWDNGSGSYTQTIGGIGNFQRPDQTWAKINNTLIAEGDSVWKVDDAVIKLRANKNGISSSTLKWDGQDYIITQTLRGIGWLKISTKGRQWIDSTMNWSNVSADSNVISWAGVSPGVDYKIKKATGQIEHKIYFKKGFLDSAVTLYNQRADSLDIALANVMVYSLSANIDNHDSAIGDLSIRQLKSFGKYTFDLTGQRLRYPGSDTLAEIPIGKFWKKRNDTIFCIEYVMMSDVKFAHEQNPDSAIWHDDDKVISTDANIDETEIYSGGLSGNAYGGRVFFRVDEGNPHTLMRVKNLSTEIPAGATITSGVCSIYVYDNRFGSADSDVYAYRIKKPWVESNQSEVNCTDGGATWDDWVCDGSEWRTAGGDCANDGGDDNTSNDVGTCSADSVDRNSTVESTSRIGGTTNKWETIAISASLLQAWYDGDDDENGVSLQGATDDGLNGDFLARSTEASEAEKPVFRITYTLPSGLKVMIRK